MAEESLIQELLAVLPQVGRVEWIGRSSRSRSVLESVESIDVEVVVTNATGADQSLDALWENVPVPVCASDCDTNLKGRVVGFARADGTPLGEGAYDLDAVHVVDEQGHGLAVSFTGPREVSVHPVGMIIPFYSERLQVGRIQIPFDTSVLASGASTTLTYSLRTLDSVASVEPVPAVTDEPQILCAEGPPPADGGVDGASVDGAAPEAGSDAGTDSGAYDGSPGPVAADKSDEDGGCGCRAASRKSANAWWFTLLLGWFYRRLTRRRMAPSH